MGSMLYAGAVVEFDDRVLTHLQVVLMQKFRRGESFPLSWIDSQAIGDGRSAMWMTPAAPVYFKFDGSRVPAIDQAWIDRLTSSADSPRGLVVTDVDGAPVKAMGAAHRPTSHH